MKEERYWLDIESKIIFDNENEKDFDPVIKLNEQDQQIAELQENQTQKAIECLKEVKEKSFGLREGILIFDNPQMQVIFNNIDNKIKELEYENENYTI